MNQPAEDRYNELISKAADLLSQQDFEQALIYCDKAINVDPERFEGRRLRIDALLNLGRHQEALEEAEKAYEIYRVSPEKYPLGAHLRFSDALLRLGKGQWALEAAENALSISTDDETAWILKGAALNMVGHLHESLEIFRQATDNFPRCERCWYHRGLISCSLGIFDEALESFSKSLLKNSPLS